MTTIEELLDLANVTKFLEAVEEDSTSLQCHQACVWLAIQIKKAGLSDYNVHIATGTYKGKDHSWIVLEDPDFNHKILDMTLDQFEDIKVPAVTFMTNEHYEIQDSICLAAGSKEIRQFVENLGS